MKGLDEGGNTSVTQYTNQPLVTGSAATPMIGMDSNIPMLYISKRLAGGLNSSPATLGVPFAG